MLDIISTYILHIYLYLSIYLYCCNICCSIKIKTKSKCIYLHIYICINIYIFFPHLHFPCLYFISEMLFFSFLYDLSPPHADPQEREKNQISCSCCRRLTCFFHFDKLYQWWWYHKGNSYMKILYLELRTLRMLRSHQNQLVQ